MPVYVRDGNEWSESAPYARDGGAWKEAGGYYHRDGGEWKLIYPDPAANSALLPPTAFAVTDGPDNNSVTVGWTNPTQTGDDPTHIQIRLAELGSVWTEMDYPATEWTWLALDDDTEYVAQIRYVIRTLGVITETSGTVNVSFTTTTAPVGPPAVDPGGDGIGDTTFPIDIPVGGGGIPGGGNPVGTTDGCWYEYEFEILSQTAYTWISTGLTGTFDGDVTEFLYDFAANLDPTRVYRLKVRTACDTDGDGIADDFGDWETGDPFPGAGDWSAQCADIPDSPFASLNVAADAQFRFPKFCKDAEGEGLVMTEATSGVEVAKGPGFFAFFTDATGEQGATPDSSITSFPFYPTMVASLVNLPTMLQSSVDWSVVSSFRALSSFSGSDGRSYSILQLGGSTVNIKLTESATGWTPSCDILTSEGITNLEGLEITFDSGNTHRVVVRWDDDDEVQLWVDGVEVDQVDVTSITLDDG